MIMTEMTYWLGFMYGDGWISGNRYGIQSKDKDIVVKFKNFFKLKNKIIESKKGEGIYYSICPTNRNFVEYLKNIGYKKEVPNLSNDEMKEFIRGLFDADGCLTNHRKYVRIHITAKPKILDSIIKHLLNIGVFKTSPKPYNFGKIMDVSHQGKQAISFLHYIYDDAEIYLDRKYKKFGEL